MKCTGCQRELEVGDRYIEDAPSAFLGKDTDPMVDGLLAGIFGGGSGKVAYCEDCTQGGGEWPLHTVYGDEGEPHA